MDLSLIWQSAIVGAVYALSGYFKNRENNGGLPQFQLRYAIGSVLTGMAVGIFAGWQQVPIEDAYRLPAVVAALPWIQNMVKAVVRHGFNKKGILSDFTSPVEKGTGGSPPAG